MDYKFATSADGYKYPKEWATERLRFLAKINPVKSEVAHLPDDTSVSFVAMESVGERGEIHVEIEKPIADVYGGYTYFVDGDIVIAKITPCFENGKAAIARGLINGVGFGTTELHVIRPSSRLDPRWFFYLANSYHFRELGTARMYGAGGQKRVPEDFLKDFIIAVPTSTEQQQIADFLDWKTGQIDRLIAKKRALVSALSEKRMAVITQAVTRGLDPTVPMKDSGINWLGKVPKHWPVVRVKFVADMDSGHTPSRTQPENWIPDECVIPWVSLNDTKYLKKHDLISDTSVKISETGMANSTAHLLPSETVVFTRDATIGLTAITAMPMAVSQHIIAFTPREGLAAKFLHRCFQAMRQELESYTFGSTLKTIGMPDVKKLAIAVPPDSEQQDIVEHIESETNRIDRVILATEAAINRLTEYRTALITAATTGKIDVRDIEIPGQSG